MSLAASIVYSWWNAAAHWLIGAAAAAVLVVRRQVVALLTCQMVLLARFAHLPICDSSGGCSA